MLVERAFSGAPWEGKVGYCRAVRAGNHVFVSGTAPVNADGTLYGAGDPYAQATRCFEIIQKALETWKSENPVVVRTRMFVTDISLWEAFGRAHSQRFGHAPPATTMVEVRGLIDPGILIEVEADVVLGI